MYKRIKSYVSYIMNNRLPFSHFLRCTMVFTLTLQETRSVHDSMNISKIESIAYIYILL